MCLTGFLLPRLCKKSSLGYAGGQPNPLNPPCQGDLSLNSPLIRGARGVRNDKYWFFAQSLSQERRQAWVCVFDWIPASETVQEVLARLRWRTTQPPCPPCQGDLSLNSPLIRGARGVRNDKYWFFAQSLSQERRQAWVCVFDWIPASETVQEVLARLRWRTTQPPKSPLSGGLVTQFPPDKGGQGGLGMTNIGFLHSLFRRKDGRLGFVCLTGFLLPRLCKKSSLGYAGGQPNPLNPPCQGDLSLNSPLIRGARTNIRFLHSLLSRDVKSRRDDPHYNGQSFSIFNFQFYKDTSYGATNVRFLHKAPTGHNLRAQVQRAPNVKSAI